MRTTLIDRQFDEDIEIYGKVKKTVFNEKNKKNGNDFFFKIKII